MRDPEKVADALFESVEGYIKAALAKDREARSALEACDRMTFRGVWSAEHSYRAGDLVSFQGGAWIATGAVHQGDRPGRGPAWRLAVKSEGGA